MSDKKLMNEVLPAPAAGTNGHARERVVSHMKNLVKVGAASVVMTACPPPFAVVDPLPEPARCKTTGDVLSELTATANFADGGSLIQVVIEAKTDFQSGVELDMAGGTIGGSIRSLDKSTDKKTMTLLIAPTSGEVQLNLTVTCDSSSSRTLLVKIDTATLVVTLFDPSRDGG
jgi:hypothetical protein